MAAVLDATVGGADSNSYATVSEADAYHVGHLYPEAWTAATADQKVNALITATRLLDENINWIGWQMTAGQALAWPRAGALYRSGFAIPNGIIPQQVKNATAEFARLLIDAGAMPNSGSEIPAGLKHIKAGSVELEYNPAMTSGTEDAIPTPVISMISFLIASRAAGTGFIVNLTRM